jgi:hypothetical protein
MNRIEMNCLLSDEELDAVAGGLAISAAANPGRYTGGKLPPLPDSGPGNQPNGDSGLGPLILGGIAMGAVLSLM